MPYWDAPYVTRVQRGTAMADIVGRIKPGVDVDTLHRAHWTATADPGEQRSVYLGARQAVLARAHVVAHTRGRGDQATCSAIGSQLHLLDVDCGSGAVKGLRGYLPTFAGPWNGTTRRDVQFVCAGAPCGEG